MAGEEYKIPLGADISPLVASLQKGADGLKTLNTEAEKSGKAIEKTFTESAKATDNFNKGLQDTNKKLGENAQQTDRLKKSYGTLQIELARYRVTAETTLDPKKLVEYNRKIQETEAEIRKLSNAGKKGFDDFGNAIKKTESNLDRLKNVAKSTLGALGLAFGIQQVLAFGKELVLAAVRAEGIKRAFDRINDPNLLSELRKATRGTVSDLELMRAAVNAKNFDVPLKNFATLLSFAQQRARDTGQSVDYLVNSLVIGIGRKSPLILDNLGINARRVREEFQRVGDFAQAAANIINEELGKTGPVLDNTADKIGRLSAGYENLKIIVGEFLVDLGESFGDTFRNTADLLTGQIILTEQGFDLLGRRDKSAKALLQQNQEEANRLLLAQTDLFKKSSEEKQKVLLDGQIKLLDSYFEQRKKAYAANDVEEINRINGLIVTQNRLVNSLQKEANSTISIFNLNNLRAELEEYQKILDDAVIGSQKFNDAKKEIARVQKQIDEATGKSEKDAAKKREERNKLIIELEKQLAKSRIEIIQDAKQKTIAEENLRFNEEIKQLEAKVKEYPEFEKQKNQIIQNLRLAHNEKLIAIELAYFQQYAQVAESNQKDLNATIQDQQTKELEDFDLAFNKRAELLRKQGLTEEEIVTISRNERLKIINKFALDEAKLEEQIAILNAEGIINNEEERRVAILNIRIQAAKEQLALLEAQGGEENKLVIAQLKNVIATAEREIKEGGKTEKRDIFEILGLNFTDEEKDLINQSAGIFTSAYSQILNASITELENDLNRREELIDSLKDQISDTRSALDEELELQKQGLANNAEQKKKELKELEKQKAKEVSLIEEATRKVNDAKKQEIIFNGILQASELAVAVAKIIAQNAALGPLGIFTVGASLAALYAIIRSSRAQIAAASSGPVKFEKGRTVKGNRHSNGGEKYYSENPNNPVLELEDGEDIINRKSSAKYANVLEAINNDDFSKVSHNDYGLNELLKGTKVGRPEINRDGKPSKGKNSNKSEQILTSIDSTLQKLAQPGKDGDTYIDFGTYIMEKSGNRTRIIRK